MKIQQFIFKFYLFILPFTILFPFFIPFRDFFSTAALISNNFFILIIGIFLFLFVNKGKIFLVRNSLVFNGIKLCVILNVISFITSVILFIPFGELNGENTLRASFPSIIYMFLTAITFYYNAMMFQLIEKRIIIKVLNFLSVILLFIGVLQLLLIKFPSITKIYDIINFANILVDSSLLRSMGRICFSSSEPSAVNCIVTTFILPYLLAQILYTKLLKYKLYAISFIFLCYFTYSSSVYIGIIINIIVFSFLYFKHNKKTLVLLLFIFLVFLFSGNYIWNNTEMGQQFQELLLQKTTSQENLSTVVRYSTIKQDVYAFLHYPLTGVGNGNQGYFYNHVIDSDRNLPYYVLQYSEISNKLDGNVGIISGGAFLPAFISGYGLIGIFLLLLFVHKCVVYINKYSEEYGCFRYMYYIAGLTFLVSSMAAASLDGNFISLFIISIPFMQKFYNNKKI